MELGYVIVTVLWKKKNIYSDANITTKLTTNYYKLFATKLSKHVGDWGLTVGLHKSNFKKLKEFVVVNIGVKQRTGEGKAWLG